ncbi:MAG: sigma 54-interacting transcriptional regulator, partial [Polyangiales bacterium]
APEALRRGVTGVVAEAAVTRALLRQSVALAHSQDTVCLEGPRGAGKTRLAQLIAAFSPNDLRPLVSVDAAALAAGALEAMLFGPHDHHPAGALQQALGGTLHLQHASQLAPATQRRLLHWLRHHPERPLAPSQAGAASERLPWSQALRFVLSDHQRLRRLVRQGEFDAELYAALDPVELSVPPLSERPEDIEALAEHFILDWMDTQAEGVQMTSLSHEARTAMLRHPWPGHAAELSHRIRRALQVAQGKPILPKHLGLPLDISPFDAAAPTHVRIPTSPSQIAVLGEAPTAAHPSPTKAHARPTVRKTRPGGRSSGLLGKPGVDGRGER